MKKLLSVLALATMLSACGDGGDSVAANDTGAAGNAGNPGSAADTPSPTGSADNFLSQVIALFGNTNDTAEPVAIDAVTVTTPDGTEPAPVS